MSTLKVNSIQPLSSTGAVTIGGSVVVSGSETFNNIGPSKFVGNLIVSNGSITGSNVVNINGQASEFSLANGQYITASGQFSHAEGLQTLASGNYSHAEGRLTQAIGNYSHAEGFGTIAAAPYQHVQGKFNQTSSVQAAFIIGNGDGPGLESNLVFAAENSFQISGSLNVSGTDHTIQGLLTSSQTNIVTINPSTGLLSYAPSLIESVSLNISCSNTSSATTTILNYGVNVIVLSTPSNYACKLPQPVTGRKVTVVNNSSMVVYLYPSNIGGQINNYAVDAPAIIPPDGKAYDFVCIENPLPGAWVWSPPATNQWDSGEITYNSTSATKYLQSNGVNQIEKTGLSTTGIGGFDSRNVLYTSNANGCTFIPLNMWSLITKIKVYTNISSNSAPTPQVSLFGGLGLNNYAAGTNTFVNNISIQVGSYINPVSAGIENIIAGTVPPPGVTANIGDEGTLWTEFPWVSGNVFGYSHVGNKFVSTDGVNDLWASVFLCINLRANQILNGIKFRLFIEYY